MSTRSVIHSASPGRSAPPQAAAGVDLTANERAVLDAIRDTAFGAVEVVVHQSRIVQIVRTEKMKVDEAPLRG